MRRKHSYGFTMYISPIPHRSRISWISSRKCLYLLKGSSSSISWDTIKNSSVIRSKRSTGSLWLKIFVILCLLKRFWLKCFARMEADIFFRLPILLMGIPLQITFSTSEGVILSAVHTLSPPFSSSSCWYSPAIICFAWYKSFVNSWNAWLFSDMGSTLFDFSRAR